MGLDHVKKLSQSYQKIMMFHMAPEEDNLEEEGHKFLKL